MKSDFFYSPSTKLYIARKPLKIDSRVLRAAEKAKTKLNWNDEGRINSMNFDSCKKLLSALGSIMLSPIEYWGAFNDAKKLNDKDMINELMSNKYSEWLDRVYLREGNFIDHAKIIDKYQYSGKKQKSIYPEGRPGWFNPEGNINKDGIPIRVEANREKFATSWKYWSPYNSVTQLDALAPIRGYVTSVGKPSWDLGIPVDSRQPLLMIRECRKKPLEMPVKEEIMANANSMIKEFKNLESQGKFEEIYKNIGDYFRFIKNHGALFKKSKEISIYKIREGLIDILGFLKVLSFSKKEIKEELLSCINLVSETAKGNYSELKEFIKNCRQSLKDALEKKRGIVFVMGHKNPDTDTAISSVFEAWRNHLADKEGAYIPVVQDSKIPDEIRELLGNEISNGIILKNEEIYNKAKNSGLTRWISVDQNREPEVQKYFLSIIDHHAVSETAKNQDLPKTLERIGSCTALITLKLLGIGLNIDKETARILYGATLMDTENRVKPKMTPKDSLIMDYLKKVSETESDSEFYRTLMSYLLNTDDADVLFKRDYKEDWGFGFAVAKIKNGIDYNGNILKKGLLKKAVALTYQNNLSKNLPLTLLRITDYKEDNEIVNRERVYIIFNKASPQFKKAVFDLMEEIVKFEFKGSKIKRGEDYIEFWGTGMQLSRKKTAPILEPIVKAFNEFFYSPSIKLWIKRDFLKKSKDVTDAEKKIKLKASFDEEKRVNYLTYPEARLLAEKLGFSILSLREYWNALNDAKTIKDIQMIESMQGSNFVEFLDTVIKDYKYAIEHPIIKNNKKIVFLGNKKEVLIPNGRPGLIDPADIDLKTGIPKIVKKPNEYDNLSLWRYWQPDSDVVIPVRSYIFLLGQPSWDGKFHIDDSFPNLGIRPCCKKIKLPKIKISSNEKTLSVIIQKEGDSIAYKWTHSPLGTKD